MVNKRLYVRSSLVSLVFNSVTNLARMSQWFYAVGRGRQVGVYTSWTECEKQVKHIANAKYRKFKTHKEAIAFIQECSEKFSPYKSPSRSRSINDTIKSPSACQPHSTSQAANLLSDCNSFYSQQVTSNLSQSLAPQLRVGRRFFSQVSSSLIRSAEMTRELSPQTIAAIESLAEQDPFLSDNSEDTTANNAVVVTSSETCVNNFNFKNCFEKLERDLTEIKSTLNQVLFRVTNLENKVQTLSSQNSAGNPNIESQSIPGSSVKRTLLESYNIPQPVGKRHFSTTNQDDEIEVVPVPPKKIPKIEVNSDDEVDGLSCDFKVNEDGYVIVYTDGACEKNGRSSAKAGVGVWFGDCHPLNVSEPVHGRPTNNTAEIQAVVQALEVAKRAGVKKIIVHTDSEFTINCITKWIHRWQKNNWKVASGGDVKNKEDLILLLDAMKGIDVKWEHVRGHQGIHGNEMADRLARSGAERYRP